MNSIYNIKEEIKPAFLDKILKKLPEENAAIEINNLLATKPILSIQENEIANIISKYKFKNVNITKELLDLYKIYLKHCFEDNIITEDENKNLVHLKSIFNLSNSVTAGLFDSIASELYKSSFNELVKDGSIDESEKEKLLKIKNELCLSNELIDKIETESKFLFASNFIKEKISDGRLSPEEMSELEKISKNLGVNFKMDEGTKAQLEKYKLYWLIENGDIPVKEVDVALQNNERCYFYTKCDFLEVRKVTERVNYDGLTYRLKLTKNFHYKFGSIKPRKMESNQLVQIDTGSLYLTNKRLIFIGDNMSKSIKLQKILSITPYTDGVEITKDSGKNPIYRFENDPELFTIMLTRLINE